MVSRIEMRGLLIQSLFCRFYVRKMFTGPAATIGCRRHGVWGEIL